MDPLSATASVVAVLQLTSEVITFLVDVKDADKECRLCRAELSNLLSLLISLRDQAERGQADGLWSEQLRKLETKDGPLDQYRQALESLLKRVDTGHGIGKLKKRLLWKFTKEQVASILERIERLKTLITIALDMDHVRLSKAIKADTSLIQASLLHVHADLSSTQTIARSVQNEIKIVHDVNTLEQHRVVLLWLSSTDYPSQQQDVIARWQDGTAQWFINSEEFQKWIHGPEKTLFCHGIPGSGKTMIAALAIDYLFRTKNNNNVGIRYVFCNYKAQTAQSAYTFAAALLAQLLRGRPDITVAKELYEKSEKQKTRPSLDELVEALSSACTCFSAVYIIVDALDECSDTNGSRGQFINMLRSLQVATDIHLLVTSRPIAEQTNVFASDLQLEVRASNEDVKQFIEGHISRLPRCVQNDRELARQIQDRIVNAVDGMFLLARLLLDSFLDKRTKHLVLSALDQISRSSTLNQAYDDAVSRIHSQLHGDRQLAMRAICWTVHSQRPLTTQELVHALAVDPTDEELNLDNMYEMEDVVSVCAGLIAVDHKSSTVRLVHYTAQDYFERQWSDEWYPDALKMMAKVCLTYLSFKDFRSGLCAEHLQQQLAKHHLLAYMTDFLPDHVRPVEQDMCHSILRFLDDAALMSFYLQAKHNSEGGFNAIPWYIVHYTPLHFASEFGLFYLVQQLFAREAEDNSILANTRDTFKHTPLWYASKNGFYQIAQYLIDKGAEINSDTWAGGTEIFTACEHGHEEIVKLLLDNGAKVVTNHREDVILAAYKQNKKALVELLLERGSNHDIVAGSTIVAAAGQGDMEFVRLLLDKGAYVDSCDEWGATALSKASAGGHEDVVRLLLNNKANVDGSSKNTLFIPLLEALKNGHDKIFELLLTRGANPNKRHILLDVAGAGNEWATALLLASGAEIDMYGFYSNNNMITFGEGTALYEASKAGHEHMVTYLLDKGAKVNLRSGFCDNALQAASQGGHEQVVQLLLHAGADTNLQGGSYGTALIAAVSCGFENIARMLLDNGADIELGSFLYGNPLASALKTRNNDMVCILLDRGANFHNQVDSGSVLCSAVRSNSERIVTMLLDAGVDINARETSYNSMSALEIASQLEYNNLVNLLVGRGADATTSGGYCDALMAAVCNGDMLTATTLLDKGADIKATIGALSVASDRSHESLVRLLVIRGADINERYKNEETALYTAALRGNMQLTEFLLDNGADANIQGGIYWNALQAASQGGFWQVVQLLLERGASVNELGGRYGSALQAASKGYPDLTMKSRAEEDISFASQVASQSWYEQTVRLLLNQGANVHTCVGSYGSALHVASQSGHEQIVRLLLDNGADVDQVCGLYGTALQAASQSGHEQVVKLLLDSKANVHILGGRSNSALQAASHAGHERIVQLLLNADATIKVPSLYVGALQAALRTRFDRIVRLLLEKAANIDEKIFHREIALVEAIQRGEHGMVNLLLDIGADVNASITRAKDEWEQTKYGLSDPRSSPPLSDNALQAAFECQSKRLIRLLLTKGANVNLQGGFYGNALQTAIVLRCEEEAPLLLDHGANVNLQGGYFGNALQAASARGCEQVAKLLLDKNADINAEGGHFHTALQAASAHGHHRIAKLLLDSRADVNLKGGKHGSALLAASAKGYFQIVELFLSSSGNVDVEGGKYGNALQAASVKGHIHIVKLLLNSNADVNANGGRFGTALQAASARGHEQIVRLLLNSGADVDAEGGRYGTALLAASANGCLQIVRLLLSSGASVDVEGENYRSALQKASANGVELLMIELLRDHTGQATI